MQEFIIVATLTNSHAESLRTFPLNTSPLHFNIVSFFVEQLLLELFLLMYKHNLFLI